MTKPLFCAVVIFVAALAVAPNLRLRAQQLVDGRGGEDDDLAVFSTDKDFRQAVGLAASNSP